MQALGSGVQASGERHDDAEVFVHQWADEAIDLVWRLGPLDVRGCS